MFYLNNFFQSTELAVAKLVQQSINENKLTCLALCGIFEGKARSLPFEKSTVMCSAPFFASDAALK